jgi:hypothetical protein
LPGFTRGCRNGDAGRYSGLAATAALQFIVVFMSGSVVLLADTICAPYLG